MRTSLKLAAFAVLLGWAVSAQAQWTWTPQTGRFVNMKRMPKETAELQIEYTRGLLVEGNYRKALRETEKFTEFYILGPNCKAENYMTSYHLGDSGTFIIGVTNHELKDESYNVLVQLVGSNRTTTLYTDKITLADNQTLEKPAHIQPDMIGTNMELQFLLYKDGNMSSPYRECHVWVNVTSPGSR